MVWLAGGWGVGVHVMLGACCELRSGSAAGEAASWAGVLGGSSVAGESRAVAAGRVGRRDGVGAVDGVLARGAAGASRVGAAQRDNAQRGIAAVRDSDGRGGVSGRGVARLERAGGGVVGAPAGVRMDGGVA